MSGTQKGFKVIGEEDAPEPAAQKKDVLTAVNTQMLLLALKALSQRALTAITNLMTIGLVVSAWMLWRSILDNPTVLQLVAVGSYAVFCLLIDLVRRRK